jgi:hypothetical protein
MDPALFLNPYLVAACLDHHRSRQQRRRIGRQGMSLAKLLQRPHELFGTGAPMLAVDLANLAGSGWLQQLSRGIFLECSEFRATQPD